MPLSRPVPSPSAAQHAPPNIVFMVADDLGYGDLGCYGQEVIQTPHLDRLAAEGMRFTQYYAGSPVCAPSRSTLLEGKHTGHVYMRGNGALQMREDPEDLIFPRALQEVGYHTAMIGKSGVGCNTDDAGLPYRKGFDEFFGFTSHTEAHFYYPTRLWRNDHGDVRSEDFPGNCLHCGDTYSSERVMKEALDFVERQREEPFFLHLAFQIPHASLRAPEEWKERYRPILKEPPQPEGAPQHYSHECEPQTTYAAMVSYMDNHVGRLLDTLERLGLADNTLVLFTSDHGPAREGGAHPDHFASNGPWRGGKRDLWDGGVRVPMIAWWPGRIAAGAVSDHMGAHWDWSVTLRELTGAAHQEDTDGLSLVPTLLGQGEQARHEFLYWEYHEGIGKRAIRQGDWKLIQYHTKTQDPLRNELFHLCEDPAETTDRQHDHPDKVTELEQLMHAAHEPATYPDFRMQNEVEPEG